MNILIGYAFHPRTTATYMQHSLQRLATTTFVGTPWEGRRGFGATDDMRPLVASLTVPPDLYLHVDAGGVRYFPRGLTGLGCPTACYLIDVHVGPKERLKQAMFFDYAFSAQRDFVSILRASGHPQAHWLPLACDPAVHRHYDKPKRYDVAFVGATGVGYERRRALLDRLARSGMRINDYHRSYTPDEMARVYSEARLGFNCSIRREVNMRLFEGPATGTLLLTDRIDNGLSTLVTDGEHVVMFDDDTLLELADTYLRDETARERIARQGREHMYAHHTYDHRVATILDTVFAAQGPRLVAPLRRRSDADVALAYADLYSRSLRVDDTIDEFKRLPAHWRYRLPAAKHVVFSLIRRIKYG